MGKITNYDMDSVEAVVDVALEATVPVESLVYLAGALQDAQVALERESGTVVAIKYRRMLVKDKEANTSWSGHDDS